MLVMEFQSTRPLRGATTEVQSWQTIRNISIHAPLAGRDSAAWAAASEPEKFQSTRPLRGATPTSWDTRAAIGISIHAPLAGRDQAGRVR